LKFFYDFPLPIFRKFPFRVVNTFIKEYIKDTYIINKRLFGISKLNQLSKALLNITLDINVNIIEIA